MARILFVDANEGTQFNTIRSLPKHTVVPVATAGWAEGAIARFPYEFDALFVHERLHDIDDGLGLARRMKEARPDLTVVVLYDNFHGPEPGIIFVDFLQWDDDKIPLLVDDILSRKLTEQS
jgi:DNA-binding LytR/AlgR family response regulator